jgi:hypothetical protein
MLKHLVARRTLCLSASVAEVFVESTRNQAQGRAGGAGISIRSWHPENAYLFLGH